MTAAAREVATAAGVRGGARKLLVVAAVVALLLAAMDATIMGTVLPKVVADLGGASGGGYAWLVSAFMLAQVAGTPVAGWISDRINDRVISVGAVALFLAASVLAGTVDSFGLLVFARVVHGLSAGAIVVSSYVVVGRLYGPERRAAAQGMLSTVWGVAAVLGPIVGAAVSAVWGWRWVFLLNVPLCLLVTLVLLFALPGVRGAAAGPRTFPTAEYALMICGAVLLLLGLQGPPVGLHGFMAAGAMIIGIGLLGMLRMFGGQLVPLQAFRLTPSGTAAITTVGACAVMYATVTVLPVRLAAKGASTMTVAVVVGVAAIGWVLGSGVTGGLIRERGYRLPMAAGGLLLLVSALCCVMGMVPWLAGLTAGLGTGAVTAAALALLQDQAPPAQLGVATSSAQMLRNVGSAVGINGIAALSAVSSANSGGDPAFWALVVVAAAAVIVPALFAPRKRHAMS